EKQYQFLAPCEVNIWMERSQCPPWGVAGGHDGLSPFALIEGDTRGPGQRILKASDLPLQAGERLTIYSGGGGGWGPPSERSRQAVEDDVTQGYISPAAARRDYSYNLKDD